MKNEALEMKRAKELFYQYHGNRFYMDHDGAGREYDSYHVSRETEKAWAEELITLFLETKMQGRTALRVYSAVTDLLNSDRHTGGRNNDNWDICLYYPLASGHLDDVTALYMLSGSFRMAETAVKKHCFSKEEADAYLQRLDTYARQVLARAENGTLTRAEDFVLQEFSDPVVVADHLKDLKNKWSRLL